MTPERQRNAILLVVGLLALGVVAFLVLRPAPQVDPGTTAPRGANAPTSPNPEDAQLLEGLRKAKTSR